jgi:hypothetical protein
MRNSSRELFNLIVQGKNNVQPVLPEISVKRLCGKPGMKYDKSLR